MDGYKFDSKVEAKYYEQLKWSQEHKQIKFFRLQPRYLLQEAFKKNGITFRKIEYVADFEVTNLDGSISVIDVKGVETEAFKIKRKLFEKIYPHKLSLLSLDNTYGWIELEELKKLKKKAGKVNANEKANKPGLGTPLSKRRQTKSLHL
jgi:hypothetical protein